ncbi:MAG: hypothetical protein OZSIB_0415 [Candidatus Ozemobacter sibiricus]|jgi:nitrite reductase/ring-hydroxylating ferredoxin subunit|uniref:Rieske domain-containing protein n=1 Tax=Candidatus Ozemobacter sibiricus TaxID=2268124 RepID=A0A367ZLU1_9BACT|nr:MAG: hypothetical protein OZSIB_0415 [Candidatus Ozemobacter sibiricus]
MWYTITRSDHLPLNGTLALRHHGWRVLLVRTAEGVFALEDKCPHQEQTMGGGLVEGHTISCPWHSVTVDLRTGVILKDMGFLGMPPMRVFQVREENGAILVDLPEGPPPPPPPLADD